MMRRPCAMLGSTMAPEAVLGRVAGLVLASLFALSLAGTLSGCEDEACEGSACDAAAGERDGATSDAREESIDAGTSDVGPPDTGEPPDAGPPTDTGTLINQSSCLPCNSGCAGGMCLTNNGANESFCAESCDSDLAGCVTGFTCADIDPAEATSAFFCISPTATCRTPGVGFGTACYGDASSCLMLQHECEGDLFALGYCTEACRDDVDCPFPYACLPGDSGQKVCKPKFLSNAERCGRDGIDEEIPCELDINCDTIDPDARCVRSEPTLPGICALPCAGGTCPPGARCLNTLRGERCLPDRCACHGVDIAPGTRDLLGEALGAVELSRCGTLFNIFDWTLLAPDALFDPYRLAFFDPIHNEPLRAPAWASSVVSDLDREHARTDHPAARAARMVEHLSLLLDRPAVPHPAGPIDPVQPLASAVAELITLAGGTPDIAALAADALDVPMALQLALAEIIDSMKRAVVARRTAVERASPMAARSLYAYGPAFVARRADGFGLAPAQPANRTLLNQTFAYGEMYGAAVDILDAIAQADLERFRVVATTTVATSSTSFLFAQDTPIGRVAIGDGESGIYDSREPAFAGAWALLVDLGGSDRYRIPVAGNISFENSVSILIDLDGNDDYGYVEVPDPLDGTRLPSDGGGRYTPRADPMMDDGPVSLSEIPRQGGARMGTAIHVDLGGGDDGYQSLRMSQGSGIFGAGVLIDDGGNDTYLAETTSQGAGAFGIGLHYDLGGNDTRRAYQLSQGFAFARGAGLSYDAAGNDRYLMDVGDPASGGDPLYFNAQRPGQANSTLGQGFAFGRRADLTGDRAFMSGGIAVLIDRQGADRYEGSIFAQGGGYWFGTGILADESGDDVYDAMWYAMGTGAHYALGLLLEGGGNDTYGGTLPRINVTIAGGHDYSAAFLIDESGNDVCNGSRITIGAGNANGIGVFVDNAGDDRYSALSNYSIGAAGLLGADVDFPGSPRRQVNVIGLFVDAGGTDTYERAEMTPAGFGDDLSWVQALNMDPLVNRIERGSGVDGVGESTLHAGRAP